MSTQSDLFWVSLFPDAITYSWDPTFIQQYLNMQGYYKLQGFSLSTYISASSKNVNATRQIPSSRIRMKYLTHALHYVSYKNENINYSECFLHSRSTLDLVGFCEEICSFYSIGFHVWSYCDMNFFIFHFDQLRMNWNDFRQNKLEWIVKIFSKRNIYFI